MTNSMGLERIKVKKGQILQHKGELHTKVYQVESGLLSSYTLDEKGRRHTFMFAPENWMIADLVHPTEPAELFIDALEESEVIILEKDPEISVAGKHQLKNRMLVYQQRIIMLMSTTAIERYEHFAKTYPEIIQRVPQRIIASYLGITPEALSKVKGERNKKNKS
ncbi:MAG: Crp/Fnr family transcriptional regulator [Bacteroidota bacterium]